MFHAFREAWIRFWDNRFNGYANEISESQDQINFLRMELEKERSRSRALTEALLDKYKPNTADYQEAGVEFKPIKSSSFESFSRKRVRLEREDRERSVNLAAEAKKSIALQTERAKTTEELEQELLG